MPSQKKLYLLFMLIILLIALVILGGKGPVPSTFKETVIVEKYYSPNADKSPIGITTGEVLEIDEEHAGQFCAMKFSNGKVLQVNCDKYLDYKIDEEVLIKYKGNQVIGIKKE